VAALSDLQTLTCDILCALQLGPLTSGQMANNIPPLPPLVQRLLSYSTLGSRTPMPKASACLSLKQVPGEVSDRLLACTLSMHREQDSSWHPICSSALPHVAAHRSQPISWTWICVKNTLKYLQTTYFLPNCAWADRKSALEDGWRHSGLHRLVRFSDKIRQTSPTFGEGRRLEASRKSVHRCGGRWANAPAELRWVGQRYFQVPSSVFIMRPLQVGAGNLI
jgi:hypothetical protein